MTTRKVESFGLGDSPLEAAKARKYSLELELSRERTQERQCEDRIRGLVQEINELQGVIVNYDVGSSNLSSEQIGNVRTGLIEVQQALPLEQQNLAQIRANIVVIQGKIELVKGDIQRMNSDRAFWEI